VGCTLEKEVFIATGASIFHGAHLGESTEVRINGVVHLKTHLALGTVVPIGWVAVRNPAKLFSPDQHEEIDKIQRPLNFPLTVYGYDRPECTMKKVTQRLSDNPGSHIGDTEVP
jgi:carbonic anhydrase/acetyltransferase-like protein (isoleucine patch superfamily)